MIAIVLAAAMIAPGYRPIPEAPDQHNAHVELYRSLPPAFKGDKRMSIKAQNEDCGDLYQAWVDADAAFKGELTKRDATRAAAAEADKAAEEAKAAAEQAELDSQAADATNQQQEEATQAAGNASGDAYLAWINCTAGTPAA